MSKIYSTSFNDIDGTVSFGGGGGGGSNGGGGGFFGGSNRRRTSRPMGDGRVRPGSGDSVVQQLDPAGANPRDPQGVHGRPDFSQGDAYSGDETYGSATGR